MEIFRLDDGISNQVNHSQDQFAVDILTGLSSTPKKISSKYFYDDHGSNLFQKITQHSDYYPTQMEHQILMDSASEIPCYFKSKIIDIVELGVGDGHKTRTIIDRFIQSGFEVHFYAVDISEQALHLLEKTFSSVQGLKIYGIIGEYFEALKYLKGKSQNPQLILFLGSNIGNFDRVQNQGFLSLIRRSMSNQDKLLIGFDLKKDISILNQAYNDSAGLTKQFNLNILSRMNHELGANFNLSTWDHYGAYNPVLGAMESFILPTKPQQVFFEELRRTFDFEAYEPIHLEYSFKYLNSDIDFLSSKVGFSTCALFSDEKKWFANCLWEPSIAD